MDRFHLDGFPKTLLWSTMKVRDGAFGTSFPHEANAVSSMSG